MMHPLTIQGLISHSKQEQRKRDIRIDVIPCAKTLTHVSVRTLDTIIDRIKTCHFDHVYNTYGASPYHPRMMLKVIIYGYMNNIYSCRKIER